MDDDLIKALKKYFDILDDLSYDVYETDDAWDEARRQAELELRYFLDAAIYENINK